MHNVSEALRALSAYQRAQADFGHVVARPAFLTPDAMNQLAAGLRQVCDDTDTLADESDRRPITRAEINSLRERYFLLGKAVPNDLVSEIMRAITEASPLH